MKSISPLVTIPDQSLQGVALERTTHLAIGAHPDDVEIIGIHGIKTCGEDSNLWFTGVVVTNGSGSARGGAYKAVEKDQLIAIRRQEQINAAQQGCYSAVIQLGYESDQIKGAIHKPLVESLKSILLQTKPRTLYLHSPLDRHATHISVCLHAIEALRNLPADCLPAEVWGMEVWRSLDWLNPSQRVVLDVSGSHELQLRLLANHKSQLQSGKRYDLAIRGRNAANATFASEDDVDELESACFGLDLSPLIGERPVPVAGFVEELANQFRAELINSVSPFRITD